MREKFAICLSMTCVLLVAALVPTAALAADVPQWSTHEVALTASGSHANAYAQDIAVTATFTGPDGAKKTVAGFWNGGKNFKIRLTPTAPGTWTYVTASSDSGLDKKSGEIQCVTPASNHGFVRIDAKHPHHFVWNDGTRYFMWGQTYYDIVAHALVNDSWKTAIDKSADYGMSKVLLEVYTDNYGGAAMHHNYPDAQPYVVDKGKPNRDKLNLAYWRKLDEIVRYLDSKGLVADLLVTDAYSNNRMFGTDAQNDRYVKYVAARYGSFHHVIWNLCFEWTLSVKAGGDYPQDKEDFERMGKLLRAADPWMTSDAGVRSLSVHPDGGRVDWQWPDSTWPTHIILQYGGWNQKNPGGGGGHYSHGDEWGAAGILENLRFNMPVVNDEYGYIGQIAGKPTYSGHTSMTQENLRGAIWGTAVCGGYGSTGDWRFFGKGKTTWKPAESADWADAPEYGDIKRMVDFFTTRGIEYWKMASQHETKPPASRTYVLAEPGRQYVVYAATGGTISVDLAAGTYYAYRYNPRTGETTDLPKVTGGGAQSFAMPDANDWVLHLSTFEAVAKPGA